MLQPANLFGLLLVICIFAFVYLRALRTQFLWQRRLVIDQAINSLNQMKLSLGVSAQVYLSDENTVIQQNKQDFELLFSCWKSTVSIVFGAMSHVDKFEIFGSKMSSEFSLYAYEELDEVLKYSLVLIKHNESRESLFSMCFTHDDDLHGYVNKFFEIHNKRELERRERAKQLDIAHA